MPIKLVPYKDFWIRIGVSLLMAVFFEFLGTESFEDAVKTRYFWPDIIAGFILAFAVATFLRSISLYFDKRYLWNKKFFQRLIYQFIVGLVLPSFFVLGYVYIYLYFIMKASTQEVVFFNNEFPIAVILIIFWNLVYVGYFFSMESKKEKK